MNIRVERIQRYNPSLIKYLYESAGMEYKKANSNFFKDTKNILLVAYNDDVPSGFLYGYILEHINKEASEVFLFSIDVFSEFKQKGVGTALIEELNRIAVNNNCSEVFVFTNENNEPAMKLYKKTGGHRVNLDDVMFIYEL